MDPRSEQDTAVAVRGSFGNTEALALSLDAGWLTSMFGIPSPAPVAPVLVALLLLVLALALIAIRLKRRSKREWSLINQVIKLSEDHFNDSLCSARSRDVEGRLENFLANIHEELCRAREHIDKEAEDRACWREELALARQMQRSLLPANQRFVCNEHVIIISTAYVPFDAVGGDFYSFFQDGDAMWFVLGDVAGKGVPAAIFMARVLTCFEASAPGVSSPADVLGRIGQWLQRNNAECMFATALCGRLDMATGELTLSSAGHEPPALLRFGSIVDWIGVNQGAPLGVGDLGYRCFSTRMLPGDVLVAFTDGVTETLSTQEDPSGRGELLEFLSRGRLASAGLSSSPLMSDFYGRRWEDDATLLALSYQCGCLNLTNTRALVTDAPCH